MNSDTDISSAEEDATSNPAFEMETQPLMKCPLCKFTFSNKNCWLKHIVSCNNSCIKCEVCLVVFTNVSNLLQHISLHSVDHADPCSECSMLCNDTSTEEYNESNTDLNLQLPTINPEAPSEKIANKRKRGPPRRKFTRKDSSKSMRFTKFENSDKTHQGESSNNINSTPYKCDQCQGTFLKKLSFLKHMRRCKAERCGMCNGACNAPTGEDKTIRCISCNLFFGNKQKLCLHVQREHLKIEQKCDSCDKVYYTQRDLSKHMANVHSHRRFLCTSCGTSFKTMSALKQHHLTHKEGKIYVCDSCGIEFRYLANLQRHQRSVHNTSPPPRFHCEFCWRGYANKYDLEVHAEDHVSQEDKILLCTNCKSGFSNTKVLKFHLRKCKTTEETPGVANTGEVLSNDPRCTWRTPWPCSLCKRAFRSKQILDNHMRNLHTDSQSLTCSDCGLVFRSSKSLATHKTIHTGLRFKCRFCAREFMLESQKHIHESKKHTGEKPHKCKFCDECFISIGKKRAHELYHSGKEIECEVCHMSFETNNKLRKHITTHTNDLPFQCEFCAKRFRRKYNLEMHLRTHTGEKPYKCHVCHNGFNEHRYLKEHLMQHQNKAGMPLPGLPTSNLQTDVSTVPRPMFSLFPNLRQDVQHPVLFTHENGSLQCPSDHLKEHTTEQLPIVDSVYKPLEVTDSISVSVNNVATSVQASFDVYSNSISNILSSQHTM